MRPIPPYPGDEPMRDFGAPQPLHLCSRRHSHGNKSAHGAVSPLMKSHEPGEDVMSDEINARPGQALESIAQDGLDRPGLLKCMAWAGVGIVWAVSGGVPRSMGLADAYAAAETASLSFVQISDS